MWQLFKTKLLKHKHLKNVHKGKRKILLLEHRKKQIMKSFVNTYNKYRLQIYSGFKF